MGPVQCVKFLPFFLQFLEKMSCLQTYKHPPPPPDSEIGRFLTLDLWTISETCAVRELPRQTRMPSCLSRSSDHHRLCCKFPVKNWSTHVGQTLYICLMDLHRCLDHCSCKLWSSARGANYGQGHARARVCCGQIRGCFQELYSSGLDSFRWTVGSYWYVVTDTYMSMYILQNAHEDADDLFLSPGRNPTIVLEFSWARFHSLVLFLTPARFSFYLIYFPSSMIANEP